MYNPLVLLSHVVLTFEQMEKQFAVKGPPIETPLDFYQRRPQCTTVRLTKCSGATHDHILGNT